MAVDFFKEEELEDQDSEQPSTQPKPLGPSGELIQGNDPTQGGGGSGKGTQSGSFTNLNAYLDANKDQQFGRQVAGRVQGEVDEASEAQRQAETGFRSAADQASVQKDDAMLGQVRTDPTKVDQGAFEKLRDATYSGPNTLADRAELYQPAQMKTAKAYQTADQIKNEGGRKAYLNQSYGSGAQRYDYTSGQQKLDNLLIQQDPDSKAAFEKTRQNAEAAKNQFSTLSSALDQYASGKKAETQAARLAARGAVGIDDAGNLTQGAPILQQRAAIEKKAQEALAARDKEYGGLVAALRGRNASPSVEAKTGISAGKALFKMDPTSERYLKRVDPTLAGVTSVEEAAKLQALARLAGTGDSFIPRDGEYGTYNPSEAVQFDKDLFERERLGKQAEFEGAYKAPIFAYGKAYTDPRTGLSITDPVAGALSIQEALRVAERNRQGYQPDIDKGIYGNNLPSNIKAQIAQREALLNLWDKLQDYYGSRDVLR